MPHGSCFAGPILGRRGTYYLKTWLFCVDDNFKKISLELNQIQMFRRPRLDDEESLF